MGCWKALRHAQYVTGQHLGKYGKLGQREGYMEELRVKQGFYNEKESSRQGERPAAVKFGGVH